MMLSDNALHICDDFWYRMIGFFRIESNKESTPSVIRSCLTLSQFFPYIHKK